MRQFIAQEKLDSKGCIYVTGKNYHYLSSVLRCHNGDMIDVRLTNGLLQKMTVAQVDTAQKKIILQIAGSSVCADNSAQETQKSSSVDIWLFMFAAKPPKMDLVIRQATECGVCTIVPVSGVYCQKSCIESAQKKSSNADERWKKIIVEARQQSGSPIETKTLECCSLEKAIELWKDNVSKICSNKTQSLGIVLYERTEDTKTFHSAIKNAENIKTVAIVIGAEGGISPQEISLLRENDFVPVHCQTNILRCETAALYGIAALQTQLYER